MLKYRFKNKTSWTFWDSIVLRGLDWLDKKDPIFVYIFCWVNLNLLKTITNVFRWLIREFLEFHAKKSCSIWWLYWSLVLVCIIISFSTSRWKQALVTLSLSYGTTRCLGLEHNTIEISSYSVRIPKCTIFIAIPFFPGKNLEKIHRT
jgi:hypothetical protein